MSAAVVVSPASGSITHLVTAVRVTCTGAPNNDSTAYDASIYPTEPQLAYYFKFAKSGQDSLVSPHFSTNSAGTAEWDDVLIPASGSWTLTLNKVSNDSVAATASVTVS